MTQYLLKVAVTAVLVVAISEIAKRSTLWAAALAYAGMIGALGKWGVRV